MQVIVADTDTGIDYNNPDLIDNVWLNQAEIPASVLPNLTDVYDDGVITFTDLNNPINQGPGKITATNGVVNGSSVLAPTSSGGWADGSTQDGDTAHPDDLIGWNFCQTTTTTRWMATATVRSPPGRSRAVGNNGIGVTGVDWNVQIMAVQFLDSSGSGLRRRPPPRRSTTRSTTAPRSSTPVGAGGERTPIIAAAIQYADQNGVIVVCCRRQQQLQRRQQQHVVLARLVFGRLTPT